MSAAQEVQIKRLPAMAPLLLRAALPRRRKAKDFPDVRISLPSLRCNARQVRRYARACGFSEARDTLPPSYLHTLAFRLQMQLMLRKDFPVAPMGSVHLSNTIIQHRGIRLDETLRLDCELAGHEDTDRGIEFAFRCRAYANNECVWEDYSLYLSRRASKGGKKTPKKHAQPRSYTQQQPLAIAAMTARRYALASGDFNPIHLHNLSAKLLGFRKMVVHGMWSKAACIAKLADHESREQLHCEVEFKTPVFLPADTLLCYDNDGDTTVFELRDARSGRPHLLGRLS